MSCPSSTAGSGYETTVRATFARLKRAGDPAGIPTAAGGTLVPVTEAHVADAALLGSLTRWREAAASAFASEAAVTREGTALWLRMGLLDAEDRMLWLVLARDGRPLGHAGFAGALNPGRELELDNVVRGEPHAWPGAMGAAVRALTGWAHEALAPAAISLRVLDDNQHAVRFYRRLGWREVGRIPLRREVHGGVASYEEAGDGEPPDREFVRMVLRQQQPA